MTYTPETWVDYGPPCIDAAHLNAIEHGIDIAQGDIMVLRGLFAALPASDPELVGRLYFATDTSEVFRDNGAGWDVVGYGGAPYRRYLYSERPGYLSQSLAINAVGRVWMTPIGIPWAMTIDRIIAIHGAVVAGNIRVGLYAQGAVDTPQGGALIAESASIAPSGIQQPQLITIADTSIPAGQYWLAIQPDDVTYTTACTYDAGSVFCKRYDRAGGYGAFTNPCPVVATHNYIPYMGARIASIP